MAPLGKERAVSLTPTKSGSVITPAAINKDDPLLLKRGIPKVAVSTAFYEDRSKFKAYVLQIRLY
jgi:hypothetical protein